MSAAGRTLHFWHSGDFGLPPLPGLSTKPLSATTYKQLTHPDTDLFFGLIQVTPRRQTSQLSLDHCESVTPLSQASVRSCNITSYRLLFHCNSTSNSLFHQFFIPFLTLATFYPNMFITASETERILQVTNLIGSDEKSNNSCHECRKCGGRSQF